MLMRQGLIHNPRFSLWSHALGYGLLPRWLLAVHRGDEHADGSESSMRYKGGDHGSHQKLNNSGWAGGANTKLKGVQSLVICYNNRHFLLARFCAPWRYGSSNMAYNGKNSEIWPKWPALMIPYLHGHGEDLPNQRCYRHMGLRSQYMPLANPHGCL